MVLQYSLYLSTVNKSHAAQYKYNRIKVTKDAQSFGIFVLILLMKTEFGGFSVFLTHILSAET